MDLSPENRRVKSFGGSKGNSNADGRGPPFVALADSGAATPIYPTGGGVRSRQAFAWWILGSHRRSKPLYLSQKRNRQLLQRKQALETTLAQIRAELAATPERLPYTEVRGQDAKIIRLERHAALTSLRLVTHHVRLQLLDLAERHFPDHRERNKFVDTLLHAGGCYQRRGEHDLVTVAAPSAPVYRRAAVRLLSDLNHLNPTALDGSGRTLIFQLEELQDPESQHFTL